MITNVDTLVKEGMGRGLLINPGMQPTFSLYVSFGLSDCIWTPGSADGLAKFLKFSHEQGKAGLFCDQVVTFDDYGQFSGDLAKWTANQGMRPPALHWDHPAHKTPHWTTLDDFLAGHGKQYLHIGRYLAIQGYDLNEIWGAR